MTGDVYILAGAEPVLYAYPSQLHPTSPPPTGGGAKFEFHPYNPFPAGLADQRHRDDDEAALAVLGLI